MSGCVLGGDGLGAGVSAAGPAFGLATRFELVVCRTLHGGVPAVLWEGVEILYLYVSRSVGQYVIIMPVCQYVGMSVCQYFNMSICQ